MYLGVCPGIIITEVAQKERGVEVIMEETCKHGILLSGWYGGLGGPVGIRRPYPAKVILAEGEIGESEMED